MRVHSNALTTLFIGCAALFSLAGRARAQSDIPITHFIFIIQENHSFDNYFGTFPNADGIPANTALSEYPGGPPVKRPFRTTDPTLADFSQSWVSAAIGPAVRLSFSGMTTEAFTITSLPLRPMNMVTALESLPW